MDETISKLEAVVAKLERAVQQLTLQASKQPAASSSSSGGPTLPNYGKSKGQPIRGASLRDLEFYAKGCERSLADESKSRWHDKERQLLEAIHAEMRRQGHEPEGAAPPPDDAPPPSDGDVPF